MHVVLDFLAERVGESGEGPHIHAHVEVLSLSVAGGDMRRIGSSDNVHALGPKTLHRAVALLPFRIVAVDRH